MIWLNLQWYFDWGSNVMKNKKKISKVGKPFVTVCTPTNNRRTFIPALIQCFEEQTYPRELMEWVVVDDGTDPVGDLFEGIEGVKYYRSDEKMNLGFKRNFMNSKASGEILVYMDDDDYYPPDRVLHAVYKLNSKPRALMAGSSKMFIYFNELDKIYQFGPYGPKHATAGTFAFKKELLKLTSFADDASVSEERHFLKGYTIPMVQLEAKKTILVFAHSQNTFDKRRILYKPDSKFVKETKFSPSGFVKNKELCEFYIKQ
jgi:glycosyltransferase involved in cell wall biosynthesis